MTKGRFVLMNNWRVLHGRAGGAVSSDRVLVGGTITREAIYSQARRACVRVRVCVRVLYSSQRNADAPVSPH